jgi:hypothetical protein
MGNAAGGTRIGLPRRVDIRFKAWRSFLGAYAVVVTRSPATAAASTWF